MDFLTRVVLEDARAWFVPEAMSRGDIVGEVGALGSCLMVTLLVGDCPKIESEPEGELGCIS